MGYKNPNTYALIHAMPTALAAPLDATTYYAGALAQTVSTTATDRYFIIPRSGFIRVAMLRSVSGTTSGSGESWDWVVRNVTTTTDYTFANVTSNNAVRLWSNYDLNIPVTAGDFIQFKTTTPTWATNPEGFVCWLLLLIECE